MRLTTTEKQEFLAEPHTGVLAVPDPGGGPPVAAPLWYAYDPGGELWLLTPRDSLKATALRSARAATMIVQTVEPRIRYVAAGCELVSERAGTSEDQRVLATRYLTPEQAEAYLSFAADQVGEETVFVLRPTRWHAADLTM